jgi:hypothetical protein
MPILNVKLESPLFLAAMSILLCALRWVFIANGFDYGWDYETGYRVYQGGIYGKDFYTALGPLSYEVIGQVFRWFGPRWVLIYPLYYGCWILSWYGVFLLLKRLTPRIEILGLVLVIVAPLSIPHLVALHLYNCLSYCLSIWCGVFCFNYLFSGRCRYLVPAAVLASLSLFTKQNLGLGVVILVFLLIILEGWLREKIKMIDFIKPLLTFGLVFAFLNAVLFGCFAKNIGFKELYTLMFIDAASAKGNFFNMLKTAVPRISFGQSNQRDVRWLIQHLGELFSYGLILGFNLICYRKFLSKNPQKSGEKKSFPTQKDVILCFAGFVFFLVLPLIIPDVVFYWRQKYFWLNEDYRLNSIIFASCFWYVIIGLVFYFFVLWKRQQLFVKDSLALLFLLIFSLGMNVWICASRFAYFFLNTPLFLSLFFITGLILGVWSRKQFLTGVFLMWFLGLFFYPTHSVSQMDTIPGYSVEGLFFSKSERDFVTFYTEKVKPWVKGKRTLWLVHGGPHSLSEAIPVRNVSNLYFDQYNTRIEESLVKDWMQHPPEMIVLDWYVTPDTSVWLRGDLFKNWLSSQYLEVTKVAGKKILKLKN